MQHGFPLNTDPRSQNFDSNLKKLAAAPVNYPESPENKFIYDFVNPVLEEGSEFALPNHAKNFFNPDDRSHLGFNKMNANQPMFNGRGDNGLPIGLPVGLSTNVNKMAAYPNAPMTLNQFNNMNANVRPSANDFVMSNTTPRDARNTSMNNTSRDSRNGSKLDISTSKRTNMSSKSNTKGAKSYQVAVNEDINLIERIEVVLNQITMNHSKVCPFCSKTIDIKKCNFQNISAFLSNTSKKYYLTHFDCYLKSNSNQESPKVLGLLSVAEARIDSQITALTSIETSNYIRSDKKAYFISIEGYHPISSFLLFKIEKICNGLENISHKNQLLYINLTSKNASMFEPNAYMIPFSDFRLVITVHMSHSNEDPYTFELLLDFSQIKLATNQNSKFAEAFYLQGGNNIILGSEIVFDVNNDLASQKAALDSSFQSTGSTSSSKPDFGKNMFVVLKNICISLPLKRIETRAVEPSSKAPIEDLSLQSQKSSGQKKPQSKLQLNPNAPLFSNGSEKANPAQVQQRIQPPQNIPFESEIINFNQNQNQNQIQNPNLNQNYIQGNNAKANTNNSSLNAPLFPQNFQFDQFLGNPFNNANEQKMFNFPKDVHNNPEEVMMPPGLNFPPPNHQPAPPHNHQMNAPFNFGMMFPNQGIEQPGPKGVRGLFVETKSPNQHDPQFYIKEEDETAETPERPPAKSKTALEESSLLKPDRARSSRGQHNLYSAVLSGKLKEGSILNSPALNKIHNHYFSEISNPGSGINTPEANTPLYQNSPKGNFADNDEVSTPQWTEDMIENFKLEDYVGRLVEFAKTYNGSRVLQRFFPRATQQEVETVILELQDKIQDLMLDPYANYMFQTLAQSCSSEQRYFLLKKISPSMIKIACDRKGTHSLQAIISLMNRDAEDKLIRDTLEGHVVELAFDAQGTHLIQKLIVAISTNNIDFIYRPVMDRFLEVANHAFGLCVLKQLMAKVEKIPECKREIINLLYQNFEELVQNPYGNYAIQHAFDIYPKECGIIFEKVVDRIVQYSNQKFSSNVVEKCIAIGSTEVKRKYVREILKSDRIVELMKNKYGNYVILKILAAVELEDKQALMHSLAKNVNLVNVAKYKTRWIQFLEENPLKVPGVNNVKGHRPSQFKNTVSSQDNLNRDEINSPMTADEWNSLRQAAVRRESREIKDDKSYFFHENKVASNQSINTDENGFENGSRGNLGNYINSLGDVKSIEELRIGNGSLGAFNDSMNDKNNSRQPYNDNAQRGQQGQSMQSGQPGKPGQGGQPAGNYNNNNNSNNNKKGKNTNQKFYSEKNQHNKDKWGYNYFY